MGITQDIEKLKAQMKVINELLRHPSKQASTVLYLVETIQKMESLSYDLETKWNTAVSYLRARGIVTEYNKWVEKLDSIEDPNTKQLFLLQPIDGAPEVPPTAPELCGLASPFAKGVTCFDKKSHEGDEHIGVDTDGKMWRWTPTEDLGEVDQSVLPEAPQEAQEIDETPEAPSEEEPLFTEGLPDDFEPEEEPEDPEQKKCDKPEP